MGILQARILEWVAMPSSRGSSQPSNWTQVSRIACRFFTVWATRGVLRKYLIINLEKGSRLGIINNAYWSEVAQPCLTLCGPMDCSPPGSSVHGIFQARILEWVAISFSRGSSQPRDRTQVSCIAGGFFTIWANREGPNYELDKRKTQANCV